MSTTAVEQERRYSEALARLRAAGLRSTRQRLALAQLLFTGPDRHVTAEALHSEAVAANVRVSLATVYNALHQFTQAGLLREVVVGAHRSYFDTNLSEHHHFFFEDTAGLADIPGDEVALRRLPEAPAGTRVRAVDVVVRLTRDMN